MNQHHPLRIVLVLVGIVGAGGWYLWDQPGLYTPTEPTMSVSQALGGNLSGFARADRPRDFIFPDDHGPHPAFRTEWWYYTGNLTSAEGRHFGFQLTFFRTALTPPQNPAERTSAWGVQHVYMAHFALSDVSAQKFHAFQRFSRAALDLAGASASPFRVWLEGWSVVEEPRPTVAQSAQPLSMQLEAEEGDVGLKLRLIAEKPVVLQGKNGLSQKDEGKGNASYYYSLTRLQTAGRIRIGTEEFQVRGLSWMDREWSTSVLSDSLQGWDWFAIQLSNGQELMCYQVRQKSGDIHPLSSGTLVKGDGTTQALAVQDFHIDTLETWHSPTDGTLYPARWRVRIPRIDMDLTITPHMADQQMHTLIRYWEGTVQAHGTMDGKVLTGNGYVEMTGYGENDNDTGPFGRM